MGYQSSTIEEARLCQIGQTHLRAPRPSSPKAGIQSDRDVVLPPHVPELRRSVGPTITVGLGPTISEITIFWSGRRIEQRFPLVAELDPCTFCTWTVEAGSVTLTASFAKLAVALIVVLDIQYHLQDLAPAEKNWPVVRPGLLSLVRQRRQNHIAEGGLDNSDGKADNWGMATIAAIADPPKIGRTSSHDWPSVRFKSSRLLSRPAIRYRDLDRPVFYGELANPAPQLARDNRAFGNIAPTLPRLAARPRLALFPQPVQKPQKVLSLRSWSGHRLGIFEGTLARAAGNTATPSTPFLAA